MQGLILLNKPKGITSFSAVSKIKRLASEKRVGHTGTLDPMATGVLPVLLGRATALSSLMLDADKRYIAKVKLGVTTDTDDITGEVLTEKEVNVTATVLENALLNFVGKIKQTPPIYSALKKDGVCLYDLARQGKTVDIPERQVEIHSIDLLSSIDSENCFVIETYVSKGTYIRSLARDIGEFLGCGATLCELERTYAAGINVSQCVELENLTCENFENYLLSEEKAVIHLRAVNITKNQAVRFCNGGQLDFERLRIDDIKENELFRVKFGNQFLGVGFADIPNKRMGIKCVIRTVQE